MNELKKVLLAGIGLTSMTVEAADHFVKDLVEKGRLTASEGKELQNELKRQGKDEADQLLHDLNQKTQHVQYATKEDLNRLESKLDQLLKQQPND